ncbi:REP-associated tyrosine transposase [Undibacterium sp.]|uniref:REP-associated tyrosine transposase n=1 Tax=Undibacterium sp. TaxID=1914977 RepID=UPI00374D19EE
MRYRRSDIPGATYFFTVNLADRKSRLLVDHIESLRSAIRKTKQSKPFDIIAMVVMPNHLHAIWKLPEDDANFSVRWSMIKNAFSKALPKIELVSDSRLVKRERGIWQRRYWEHQIKDDGDLEKHVNYIHFNPVKHGFVKKAANWPHSSIHREIAVGNMDEDWAFLDDVSINE